MSSLSKSDHDSATRFLLGCGVIGPALFVVALLIEGAIRTDGYSVWRNFGSQLALGDQGWQQIANFIICGVLVCLFAIGLRRVLLPGKSSVAGPVLMAVFGLGLIVAGVFVTDPGLGYPPGTPQVKGQPTVHGAIHALSGLVVFLALAAAAVVMVRRFRQSPQWTGWAVYSAVTGATVLLFFIASLTAGAMDENGTWQTHR